MAQRLAEVEVSIARFDTAQAARVYALPALLLRSESSSSSQIERLTSSVRSVALAELAVAAGAILSGIMLKRISAKLLCTIAAILLLFGGVATLFEHNIVIVLVCVLLQAFGAGL